MTEYESRIGSSKNDLVITKKFLVKMRKFLVITKERFFFSFILSVFLWVQFFFFFTSRRIQNQKV